MEKRKRWQLFLILVVLCLTIYNILPTIFYYVQPLKKPIGQEESMQVAKDMIKRVNTLENFTISWLKAESQNLKLKPVSIILDSENPKLAKITFKTKNEAEFFEKTLQRAGALIPFVPAQLSPKNSLTEDDAKTVWVERRIGIHLDPSQANHYFKFIPKTNNDGFVNEEYRKLVTERAKQLALGFGGVSPQAKILKSLKETITQTQQEEIIRLARNIVEYDNIFGDKHPITSRYYASFTQLETSLENKQSLIQSFIAQLEKLSHNLRVEIENLKQQQEDFKKDEKFLTSSQQQNLETFSSQRSSLDAALQILKRNISLFTSGISPLTSQEIDSYLYHQQIPDGKIQYLEIGAHNPFIEKLLIHWNKDTIDIILHQDVIVLRNATAKTEKEGIRSEKLNQLLFNEIAVVARFSEETITPDANQFTVNLNQLTNSSSLLAFDLEQIAVLQTENLTKYLQTVWTPEGELSSSSYPIMHYDHFRELPQEEQKLGLVVYAPILESKIPEGFRNGSIYVIAKGMGAMLKKYEELPASFEKQSFEQNIHALFQILRENGFIGYPANTLALPSNFKNDFIFELDDYFSYLLAATREDFSVKGDKRFAILEFTDLEQRILTKNKIDTAIHEDLIKWKDEYQAAQISLIPGTKYDVPKPTKNLFLSNLKLSTIKYFRGDNRKILKWGLDLSGGKTVRIGLKDKNNQIISNEADLKQAIKELYTRVNRLGLSEVSIRTEGSTIVLDFPGSQGLSATDLVKASAMYFHVINEKFTPNNTVLAEAVNTFLEGIWNEAVITNRTSLENLNEIAWRHLGGDPDFPNDFHPLTSDAQLLYANGLRFASPKSESPSSRFDDSISAVVPFRGKDFTEWQGQTYPLVIVFRNYALEGADLINVQSGYDPAEGNILNFGVRGSYFNREDQKINPRDDFFAWTSQFSEEKIAGTPKENFSRGKGWRMAVVLNGTIVNAPVLNSPLRDQARISGHFSQREINQLAADLKAGSLSFTPHILSEENISPDLGKEQRFQGIAAAIAGFFLVIVVMCAYYRFGGFIASIALCVNLLIIWAILQNLGAALTLPSIAGIILAMGMAVDANVLVFERIREEFSVSGRLASAIHAGYKKAFTAIVDSNLTTILAALILLNFDSGPIKGLALTLIIGIVSSMFTALFMTRYFFAGWIQNPAHKTLNMANLFGKIKIDFLKGAKIAFISGIIVILAGAFLFVLERHTIFGMDFTGGYSLTTEIKEKPDTDYRLVATHALEQAGISPSEFHIRELNKPNQLKIQLSTNMENPGKPFYHIEEKALSQHPLFKYQENPRILWIVNALEKEGLELNPSSLPNLDLYWTEMSGQLSDTMRNNALIGLGLALLGILIYITFRFELKYAISATIGILHDLLITLSILAILHLFFENIRIDLQVIAALLTIVGYSLNDTIIIFDRIREDVRLNRKKKFQEIIYSSLNSTLGRTMMTSGTTLVALLALTIFGGPSIFNFAFVMTLGVVIGTLSSLYIASPLLLFFHNKELKTAESSKASSKTV